MSADIQLFPLLEVNPNYNWIYKRLVRNENDLVGAIAYVLYKEHKIEFIRRIEQETGEDPTKEQWVEFHRVSCLDSTLSGFQKRAEELVNEFLRGALASFAQEIEEQADARMEEKVRLLTQPLVDSFTTLKGSVDSNHNVVLSEITNKKSKSNRLGEAFLNILYGAFVILLIGGAVIGYKVISNLTSKAESIAGLK
ncbi:hypothetical protein J580_1033 [Acinetobacter sp. 1542444]|uniref:hypothetical protein n=1 Tax=Acinetobacter sp. 1542444 TaxID=1310681 RepID=UPI00044B5432|nr:hypothetical protein [Acinetobacter sp. 1542444]EXE62028.1 hypothetical protein J580_1033 [Acinetobacter sp. 1542444]